MPSDEESIQHALNRLEDGELFYLGDYAITESGGRHVCSISKHAIRNIGVNDDSVIGVWVDKTNGRIVINFKDEAGDDIENFHKKVTRESRDENE
jgi:hypothetical protein